MKQRQKGFTSTEILIALTVFSMMLVSFHSGYQALMPVRVLAAGEQARQWATMAEVLRAAHGLVRDGMASDFLSSFRTAPGAVMSPFATEYRLRLPAQSAAEASFLMPAPKGHKRRTYYADQPPHSRATVDKILLYQQTVR